MSLSTVELVANDNHTARWATGMADWTYDKADPVTVREGREGSFKHEDLKVTVDVTIVASWGIPLRALRRGDGPPRRQCARSSTCEQKPLTRGGARCRA